MISPSHFLGLGKVMYSSGICWLSENCRLEDTEIYLTERLTRKKSAGDWPVVALEKLRSDYEFSPEEISLAENRDVLDPLAYEKLKQEQTPFFEYLQKKQLHLFSRHFNPEIEFIGHHEAHALSAEFMSPYEKALILVVDGAGSNATDLQQLPNHLKATPTNKTHYESMSLYALDKNAEVSLRPLKKLWHDYRNQNQGPWKVSDGLGMFYERAAEFIFNSNQAAGKVMGLASFGKAEGIISSRSEFIENLPFDKRFIGKTKKEWEASSSHDYFKNLAATVQTEFEKTILDFVKKAKEQYPDYENLILVGGCALNCTTNGKILSQKIFHSVYVPPFPGDGGISLGCAYSQLKKHQKKSSAVVSFEDQHGFLGPKSSIPTEDEILATFKDYKISKPDHLEQEVAEILKNEKIVAWFQGRSESGPRALGHRSLLASVDRKDLKSYLNQFVKFRESFRPYGCSVIYEKAHEFFEIDSGTHNPYMSFAVKVKAKYKERLDPVVHIDGSSRMQTVQSKTNPRFHKLLLEMDRLTGLPLLLNTSLNIMGEPICETIAELKIFFEQSVVDILVVEDYVIRK